MKNAPNPTIFRRNALVSLIAGLSLGTTASAQTVLEEIIVSANKTEQTLQEVPLAISAIPGSELAKAGVVETADLSARVPNLQVTSPYANVQPNFSLRGISVGNEFNANQASPIGVYVDENYLAARFAHGMQLYDLERLEVLRGPQGTLYGRNTTGGAINIITRKAQLAENNGFVTAKLGNFGLREITGAYEHTLIPDQLGVRIAATTTDSDGQIENLGPNNGGNDLRDQESESFRLSTVWAINDDVRLTLKGYYSDFEGAADAPYNEGVLPGGTDVAGSSRAGLDFWESNTGNTGDMGVKGSGGSATLNWDLSDTLSLVSITALDEGDFFVEQDADGGPVDIFNIRWAAEYRQVNQEFRLDYQGDRLTAQGGVYYGRDTLDTRNNYNFFQFLAGLPFVFPPDLAAAQAAIATGNPAGLVGNLSTMRVAHRFDQIRDSQAVFGEMVYQFTDDLTLTFGLRHTQDSIEIERAQSIVSDAAGVPQLSAIPVGAPDATAFLAPLDEDYSDTSGRVILSYNFDYSSMGYLSYSKGYRAGAINGTAYFTPQQLTFVDPEQLDAYEVGFKTRLLNDRLQLNTALYYYDYRDQQVQEIVGVTPFLRNAGKAEVIGLEFEALAAVTDRLTVGFNFGYIESEYKDLTLSGVDLSGNEFTNAPEMTANINADWTVASVAGGDIVVRADASFIGDQWFSPFNDKPSSTTDPIGNGNLQQDAYWLLNGRVGWESENVELAVWGRNLADEEYFTYGLDLRPITGTDYLVRGARRSFGVEASYHF